MYKHLKTTKFTLEHNTQDHRLLVHPHDPLQSTKTENVVSVTVAAVSVVSETLLH